jgi:transcriptional regulator with XRE-family HTH domain
MTPGSLVKEARTAAGLTQAELARRAGTTQSAIARLEADEVSPRWDTVLSLVNAAGGRLEITLDTLSPGAGGEEDVIDEHDWSIIERNLSLTPDQRLDKATKAANFVLEGRRAMRAALGDG